MQKTRFGFTKPSRADFGKNGAKRVRLGESCVEPVEPPKSKTAMSERRHPEPKAKNLKEILRLKPQNDIQVGRHCEGAIATAAIHRPLSKVILDCFVTNVPRNDAFKKYAFTLAEVLITLAIIGVVAAMTIPTLMNKIRNKVYYNQLLESRAKIEQGFRRIMAMEQTTDVRDALGINNTTDMNEQAENAKAKIMEGFKVASFCINKPDDVEGYCGKHLRNHPIIQYEYLRSKTPVTGDRRFIYTPQETLLGYAYTLMDGTLFILSVDGEPYRKYTNLIIDTNGDKAPNRPGYDIFRFILSSDGHLFGFGSKEMDSVTNGTYWKNCGNRWCGCADKKFGYENDGEGCAARAFEEGGIFY